MPNVSLTPELNRFAEGCVAAGRYNNVSEVVRAALRLLQEREEQRAAFTSMLDEAEADVAAGRVYELDEVMAEMDEVIAAAEAAQARKA
ncbi:type II toxin-antitoxin system ParD family antitoxin [Paeniroseomonas aquatica]|uniref:Type II toxin-antitoxin system ParD family antitoxin n=1 Tax=Paeniroseomonas aquatica TaxID=373043 RepID=A0ABT8AAR5_9PROT|nr:type II toxin-antitoxin system ParD family antitoxin [Paeniroseomonas aquatica]MDN3566809.1 type II toxin-antitoxin system ParD family antitoxin [Paeniroseomonas aquatica]